MKPGHRLRAGQPITNDTGPLGDIEEVNLLGPSLVAIELDFGAAQGARTVKVDDELVVTFGRIGFGNLRHRSANAL